MFPNVQPSRVDGTYFEKRASAILDAWIHTRDEAHCEVVCSKVEVSRMQMWMMKLLFAMKPCTSWLINNCPLSQYLCQFAPNHRWREPPKENFQWFGNWKMMSTLEKNTKITPPKIKTPPWEVSSNGPRNKARVLFWGVSLFSLRPPPWPTHPHPVLWLFFFQQQR